MAFLIYFNIINPDRKFTKNGLEIRKHKKESLYIELAKKIIKKKPFSELYEREIRNTGMNDQELHNLLKDKYGIRDEIIQKRIAVIRYWINWSRDKISGFKNEQK